MCLLILSICYSSSQVSQVGQPTAGAGTLTSAAWAATLSAATPAPGPRPPPASASTMPGHTRAGHAAPGAPCSLHQAKIFLNDQHEIKIICAKIFTLSSGHFYSHSGWDGDTKKYSQTDSQWTLVAPPGKRVLLRIKDFYVKLFTFLFFE